MRFPTFLLVLLPSIAGTVAAPTARPALAAEAAAYKRIAFLYYHETDANCSTTELGELIPRAGKCHTLAHSSKSFKIGARNFRKQLVEGCTLVGYAGKHCDDSVNLMIVGPSNNETCYVVGTNMGKQYPIRSVIVEC